MVFTDRALPIGCPAAGPSKRDDMAVRHPVFCKAETTSYNPLKKLLKVLYLKTTCQMGIRGTEGKTGEGIDMPRDIL